jgi:hypothetical protein
MGDNETLEDESLERALADLELLQAAYPDEVTTTTTTGTCTTTTTNADTTAGEKLGLCTSFPLQFTLTLSEHAGVTMELTAGYPTTTGVQIATYRSNKAHDKGRLEATVSAIRRVSLECQHDEIEGGFQCCSTALETWNDHLLVLNKSTVEEQEEDARNSLDTMEASALILQPTTTYEWVSSQEALEDKKSKFVAHLCRVHSEWQVREALHQLLSSSSKLQRASHNMVGLFFCCRIAICYRIQYIITTSLVF